MINKYYKPLGIAMLIMVIAMLTSFCGPNKYAAAKKAMSEDHREFIEKGRYLINNKDRKIFYSLSTAEERDNFIDGFWEKRDPDPATEENEFRVGYFKRLEQANHLFKDERKEGWLTSRGRVYIMLGEPDRRRFNPGIVASGGQRQWYNLPHEIWYYGFYPIYFIDKLETGTFELIPASAQYLSTIISSIKYYNPQAKKGGPGKIKSSPFEFSIQFANKKNQPNIKIKIPYRNILFQQYGDKDQFSATLTVHFEIYTPKGTKVFNATNDHALNMDGKQLEKAEGNYEITLPIEKLEPGKYEARVVVESKSDDISKQQAVKFKI